MEKEIKLESGQIWGHEVHPVYRIERVNEKTVTVDLYAPIVKKWFQPRDRDRRIEKRDLERIISREGLRLY